MERRDFGKVAMAGTLGRLLRSVLGQSGRKEALQASYAGLGRPPMKWGIRHSMQIGDLINLYHERRNARSVEIYPFTFHTFPDDYGSLIAGCPATRTAIPEREGWELGSGRGPRPRLSVALLR